MIHRFEIKKLTHTPVLFLSNTQTTATTSQTRVFHITSLPFRICHAPPCFLLINELQTCFRVIVRILYATALMLPFLVGE